MNVASIFSALVVISVTVVPGPRPHPAVASTLHSASGAPGTIAASRLDDLIEEDLSIVVPASPCLLPGATARIAQAIGMPAGIEPTPEPCVGSQRVSSGVQSIPLRGFTARAALDLLVKLDPRYRWMETHGVIVMRPQNAWADASHFLNRTATSFHLEAANFGAALRSIQTALGAAPMLNAEQFGGRTPQGRQPISVHINAATSAYEALNSVVRAHGAMRWRVEYCAPRARHEFATMRMETYDGSGVGGRPAVLRDDNGRLFDACLARR